jgi:hypothetical protein
MKKIYPLLIFICFFVLIDKSFAQRQTIAVIAQISNSNENNEKTNFDVKSVKSFFNDLMLEIGFDVVERESINELFAEFNDQKRADYLDGKTIRVKLKGAKDFLFINMVNSTNSEYFIYFSLTDVFQRIVLLNGSLILSKKNLEKELLEKKKEIINAFNNKIGLELFYLGLNMDKKVKLFSVNRFHLEKGATIFGFTKDNLSEPILKFETESQLSPNIVQGKIIFNAKKILPKIEEFDFQNTAFNTSSKVENIDLSKSVEFSRPSCLSEIEYMQLLISIKSNYKYLLIDRMHSSELDFEISLQSNTSFIDGKSYYKAMQLAEIRNEFDCKSVNNKYLITLYSNGKFAKDGSFSNINEISSFINN